MEYRHAVYEIVPFTGGKPRLTGLRVSPAESAGQSSEGDGADAEALVFEQLPRGCWVPGQGDVSSVLQGEQAARACPFSQAHVVQQVGGAEPSAVLVVGRVCQDQVWPDCGQEGRRLSDIGLDDPGDADVGLIAHGLAYIGEIAVDEFAM